PYPLPAGSGVDRAARGSGVRRIAIDAVVRRHDDALVGQERDQQARDRVDMCAACSHAVHMSKMIQVRNVPDAVHRKVKARAAQAGMTLSDYLLAEIERIAALPTWEEMRARLRGRAGVKLKTSAAEAIRRERESA